MGVGAPPAAENLLRRREPVRGGRGRVKPHPEVVGIVETERALRAGPSGRLDHQREATSSAKLAAAAAESASRCRAHGTPAARSTDFICALSKVVGSRYIDARDVQVSRTCA